MTEAALVEIPQQMTAIRDAIANGDHARLRLAAHTLRGAVRYFSAHRACEQAAKLEDLGRKGQLADSAAILADLEAEIAEVTATLSNCHSRHNVG